MPKLKTGVQGERHSMTQPEVKVCRICFAMNCELHLLYENMKLYKGYEAVTGLTLGDEEDLPPYLCTNCASQLMNCAHFRHRSLQAHLMLLDILKKHDHITVEYIKAVVKTKHCGSDIEHTEEERTCSNFQIEIKSEDISEDPNATELGDEIKIEFDPDDDLVGDEAVAPCGVELNDVLKNDVVDETSVNDVVDRELGTGDCVFLDGLPSGQEDKLNTVEAREGAEVTNDLNPTEGTEIDEKSVQNVTMYCDLCGYKNDNEIQFLRHLRSHTGSTLDNCDARDNKSELGETKSSHVTLPSGRIQHLCNICGTSFNSTNGLGKHMYLHLVKDFTCDICKKSFNRKAALRYHMLIHFRKPYCCDICKRAFRSKCELKSHKRIHSSIKPFGCDICWKSFVRKACLERHMLVHSIDAPFKCDVCQKSYRQKRYLILHQRIHSDEKPFSCDVCEKSYRSKSDIKRHMVIHSSKREYTCKICKRSFFYQTVLKRHMIVHSGKKLFTCEICNVPFSRRVTLDNHRIVHSTNKTD